MNEHELIRLGMMVQELNTLKDKYGLWLQSAQVYSPETSESIVELGNGGGDYTVLILKRGEEDGNKIRNN